ncbi:MAG TPA: hypothetical protein VLV89_09640 [Candidatus Acidoferrum sp.]|nr:hypothetical protein [Candidatus Acidoferrum sp.]
MIQVWKMPLKSGRSDFRDDSAKVDRARAFCMREGWTGIGWGIESLDDELTRPGLYEKALSKTPIEELGFGEDIGPARSAHRALAHRMQVGDLVWCRAKADVYWLGRVVGSWVYRNTGEFADFDLYQIRRCKWIRVGPADLVPGPVKNAYAGRGSAISQIQREHDAALRDSAIIWRESTSEAVPDLDGLAYSFSLSELGHDDLEDLVAMYLQVRLGWFVVPSTVKRATPYTEFVLRNGKGARAYLQVKSGNARVVGSIEVPAEVDTFFLFDAGEETLLPEKVDRIGLQELQDFAKGHRRLLPRYLQRLFE